MNGPDLIRTVRETPAVHGLMITARDREDLSGRERALTLAAILMTLVATRGTPVTGLSEAGQVAILALNPGGELHDLAPVPSTAVRLYTAEEAWGTRSAWGFVTDSTSEKHRRSGTLGEADHDTLALTAILEGLLSVPHGSTVQVYSRNMNADGYMTSRYMAKSPALRNLIDDVRHVVQQARLNVTYTFLTDRARKSHTGQLEAENLALSTIRGSA